VLLPDRLKAGVEPVWKDVHGDSVPVTDSAARAPVDTAAARAAKAALDSAAADSIARKRRRKFRRDSIAAAESLQVHSDSAKPAARPDSSPPGAP